VQSLALQASSSRNDIFPTRFYFLDAFDEYKHLTNLYMIDPRPGKMGCNADRYAVRYQLCSMRANFRTPSGATPNASQGELKNYVLESHENRAGRNQKYLPSRNAEEYPNTSPFPHMSLLTKDEFETKMGRKIHCRGKFKCISNFQTSKSTFSSLSKVAGGNSILPLLHR
jgi:hypothetical protein